ncbi:hypothetical protein [Rhizobium sp. FKY42]|uniref:hypothetical protein n=1 Tax=Rhizobium sp. FKY42 TaxID=2562310 RepID=UPI0010C02A44|nr:hypothetical protein [Rhizobium sp. FKY42]
MTKADANRKPRASLISSTVTNLGFALLWGACCSALIAWHMFTLERFEGFHLSDLIVLYGIGASFGWLVSAFGLYGVRRLVWRNWLLYLLAVTLLGATTVAITSGLFALQYRSFYAQWHEHAFTRIWILQFLFTSASAVYQFLVIGLRYYFPVGLPLLLGAAAILVRSVR